MEILQKSDPKIIYMKISMNFQFYYMLPLQIRLQIICRTYPLWLQAVLINISKPSAEKFFECEIRMYIYSIKSPSMPRQLSVIEVISDA